MVPSDVSNVHLDGYEGLAAAVLRQAVVDLRSVCPHDQASARRFLRNRGGMLEFWCGLVQIEYQVVARLALGDEATVGDQVEVEQGRPRSRTWDGPTAEERVRARLLLKGNT